MSTQRPNDVTINEDRYIRMPVKMLWIFVAGLVLSTYAYFDVIRQEEETRKIAVAAQAAGIANNAELSRISNKQDMMNQKLSDFIDSSERVYNRYFREATDPDYNKRK